MTTSARTLAARCCLLLLAAAAPALAQVPVLGATDGTGEVVSWKTSLRPADGGPQGRRFTLLVSGTLRDGWHVYSLKQLPLGPTPLRVALDANPGAAADGAVVESPPTTIHDPRFGLDTHFYSHTFVLQLPVRLTAQSGAPGRQLLIPVSVRFQACSSEICEPPRTIHLSVPVQ